MDLVEALGRLQHPHRTLLHLLLANVFATHDTLILFSKVLEHFQLLLVRTRLLFFDLEHAQWNLATFLGCDALGGKAQS